MRRALLIGAALALPISGASVALASGGQAFAGTTIVCTTITDPSTGFIALSGCTGGNTGGGSQPVSVAALANGGTINWLHTPNTTTFAKPTTLVATSAKKCPGYVKGASSNPTAEKFAGVVTGDSGNGLKVPGKYSGAVCISTSGNITALKPVKAN